MISKKLKSFNGHVGYKILRSRSPQEFFIALAIGLLLKSNIASNTSLHGNSAYSRIGKVFPAVDMFLFSVQNQKIVQLCIMK